MKYMNKYNKVKHSISNVPSSKSKLVYGGVLVHA